MCFPVLGYFFTVSDYNLCVLIDLKLKRNMEGPGCLCLHFTEDASGKHGSVSLNYLLFVGEKQF